MIYYLCILLISSSRISKTCSKFTSLQYLGNILNIAILMPQIGQLPFPKTPYPTDFIRVFMLSQAVKKIDFFFSFRFFFQNFIFIVFYFFFYFKILYWVCHTSTWICHGYTCVPHPEPPFHLLPRTIPLGHPSAPAPSILYHPSNLDWCYIFQILKSDYILCHLSIAWIAYYGKVVLHVKEFCPPLT